MPNKTIEIAGLVVGAERLSALSCDKLTVRASQTHALDSILYIHLGAANDFPLGEEVIVTITMIDSMIEIDAETFDPEAT